MKRISMQIYTAALATVLGLLGTVAGASTSAADALPDPQHTEQLKATAALRESAAENERVALGRLRAGVGTVIDALTAQSAAAIARQQRIEAELAWQVGRARLAAATGHLAFENAAAVPAAAITPAPGGER
jgi:hypothetical protein